MTKKDMSVLLAKFRSNIEKSPTSKMEVTVMEPDEYSENTFTFEKRDLEYLTAMEGGLLGEDIYLNYDHIIYVIMHKYV